MHHHQGEKDIGPDGRVTVDPYSALLLHRAVLLYRQEELRRHILEVNDELDRMRAECERREREETF